MTTAYSEFRAGDIKFYCHHNAVCCTVLHFDILIRDDDFFSFARQTVCRISERSTSCERPSLSTPGSAVRVEDTNTSCPRTCWRLRMTLPPCLQRCVHSEGTFSPSFTNWPVGRTYGNLRSSRSENCQKHTHTETKEV